MFERIKKAFQREAKESRDSTLVSAHGPVSEWAASRGMTFSGGTLGNTMTMQGKVGGRTWRMELGRPTRDYIVGEELRARAELGASDEVAAMIISSRRLSDRRARGGAAAATACGCVDCAGGAETTVCGAGANVCGADGGGDSSSAAAAGVCANGGIAVEWI